MTLHPPDPKRAQQYKIGFFATGILSVLFIVFQAKRSTDGQIAVQKALDDLAAAERNAAENQKIDSALRKQAEQNLALGVKAVGQETRKGVVENIAKAPIQSGTAVLSVQIEKIVRMPL